MELKNLCCCREIARMLADEHMKRVIIVDTSNEIGGDGDVPHSGIGRARRMQVPNVNMQHSVSLQPRTYADLYFLIFMVVIL